MRARGCRCGWATHLPIHSPPRRLQLARAYDTAVLTGSSAAPPLRFGYLDAGLHPVTAAELGVDVSPLASQLPSVLLLEPPPAPEAAAAAREKGGKGVPVPAAAVAAVVSKRLPYVDDAGNAAAVRLDRRAITIYFGLDGRTGAGAAAAAPPPTPAQKKRR